MEMFDIRESGSNALLKYALSNGVNVLRNQNFQNIINNDIGYFINIGPVNFMELFHLMMKYRSNPKIRIIDVLPIDIPSDEILAEYGDMRLAIKETLNKSISLLQQMLADSESIPTIVSRMYVPMICQSCNIRLPISFTDLIYSLDENEYNNVFNKNYPNNLNSVLNSKSLLTSIAKMVAIDSEPVLYNGKTNTIYDKIIYKPIDSYNGDTIYKYGISSYGKFNPLTGGHYWYDENIIGESCPSNIAAKIDNIRSPFEAKYAIELPIEYMKDLISNLDDVNIEYMSGMNYNASKDIQINDFSINGITIPISKYASRITEIHNEILASITMLNDDSFIGGTYKYGLLMPSSPCRAVITLNENNIIQYKSSVKNNMNMSHFINDITGNFSKLMIDISQKNIKYTE